MNESQAYPEAAPLGEGFVVPLKIGEKVEWICLSLEAGQDVPRVHWLLGTDLQGKWNNSSPCHPMNPRTRMGPYKNPNEVTFRAHSQVPGQTPGLWDNMYIDQKEVNERQITAKSTVDPFPEAIFYIWRVK